MNLSDRDTYKPPERLSKFRKLKHWMRPSQCIAAADEWIAMTGYSWGYLFWNNASIESRIHQSPSVMHPTQTQPYHHRVAGYAFLGLRTLTSITGPSLTRIPRASVFIGDGVKTGRSWCHDGEWCHLLGLHGVDNGSHDSPNHHDWLSGREGLQLQSLVIFHCVSKMGQGRKP